MSEQRLTNFEFSRQKQPIFIFQVCGEELSYQIIRPRRITCSVVSFVGRLGTVEVVRCPDTTLFVGMKLTHFVGYSKAISADSATAVGVSKRAKHMANNQTIVRRHLIFSEVKILLTLGSSVLICLLTLKCDLPLTSNVKLFYKPQKFAICVGGKLLDRSNKTSPFIH